MYWRELFPKKLFKHYLFVKSNLKNNPIFWNLLFCATTWDIITPKLAVKLYRKVQERILDRDTVLEITHVQLQDGAQIQVFAHIWYIVIGTQQAQKSTFLHDVPFVCHMCADHFKTYVWIRFGKFGQFSVEWAFYRQNPTFLAPCGSIWSLKKFGVKINRFLIHLLKSLLYIYKIPLQDKCTYF